VGGCTQRAGANSMATSGLVFRSNLVGTGGPFLAEMELETIKRSHLVGPPFPEFKAHFLATAGWNILSRLN